jgi:uncharacterized membrane protein YphA (DoxX/SURF4 family)
MGDAVGLNAARVPRWPLAAARIYLGVVFAVAGLRQLADGAAWVKPGQRWPAALHAQLVEWSAHTPSWFAGVVARLLPHTDGLAPVVAWLHVAIGVLLVVGLATRLTAGVAFLLLWSYMAAAGGRPWTPGPTAVFAALALAVSLGSAGRVWGADGVLVQRWRRDPQLRGVIHQTWADVATAPGWVVVPLRLYFGAAFLSAASNKAGTGNWSNWPMWMGGVITDRLPHVVWFYRPFLSGVVLPHVGFFAPLVALTEIVVGVSLLLGGATRPAAAVGMLLTADYFLLDGMSVVDVSNDFAFVVGLAVLFFTAAGRVAGLDRWFGRRAPPPEPEKPAEKPAGPRIISGSP